jgi:hypothetical protein
LLLLLLLLLLPPPLLLLLLRPSDLLTRRPAPACLHAQSLSAAEVRAILPKLVALPEKQAPAAFKRIFYAHPPPLGPTQLLVALHELSPSRDGVGVEAVKRAVKLCMDAPKFFDEGALEEALRQLVRIEPLPWLLLRTILQVRHCATTSLG